MNSCPLLDDDLRGAVGTGPKERVEGLPRGGQRPQPLAEATLVEGLRAARLAALHIRRRITEPSVCVCV